MTLHGRPVRFVATVLGGWTLIRVTMSLSFAPALPRTETPVAKTVPGAAGALDWMFPARRSGTILPVPRLPLAAVAPLLHPVHSPRHRLPHSAAAPEEERTADGGHSSQRPVDSLLAVHPAFAEAPHPPRALADYAQGAGLSATEAGLPPVNPSGRWSGAAWIVWRPDDGTPSYARGPRLGASQAGVRIDYALAPASRFHPALYGRVSSALQNPAAAEVAAGLAIHPPSPIPLTLAVERREGVSPGGRSAFALLAAMGFNPIEVGHGFRLDGYAQAGVVGLDRRDGFADGRVTVERTVAGAPDLALGAAIWGGTQPGVSRLDIGPQASLRVRAGGTTFRLGAEWRQQIAGNATPASGPALSLGTDF